MMPIKDMIGKRSGRLLVVSFAGLKNNAAHWNCVCDCGGTHTVRGDTLREQKVRSCGCLHSETSRAQGKKSRTHGMSKTNFYHMWAAMINRCENKNQPAYKYYGARGIAVCERWHKFENFLADMGMPPKGHWIERRNNEGDYTPLNCYWATVKQQQNNKRGNRLITYQGETKTLTQWAEARGLIVGTLWSRLDVLGWPVDKALGFA